MATNIHQNLIDLGKTATRMDAQTAELKKIAENTAK